MKRRTFINCAGKTAFIAGLAAGCTTKTEKAGSAGPLVDTPEQRAEYLAGMLKELCTDIGPHPIGSPALETACLIVKREMERSLPRVALDTFLYERWLLTGDPSFSIDSTPVETYLAHGTQGTPPEGITGVLREIDGNDKLPYGVFDQTSGDLQAYVSVASYKLAVPLPFYHFDKKVGSLPIFHIGTKDAGLLKDAVEKKSPIHLKANVEFIPDTPISNVVGTLPGRSDEEAVFLAHIDTVYNTVGANDNTASLIMVLMLAHALSGTTPEKTLTFIATTAEEYDKLGAINYVEGRRKAGTLDKIRYVFNFDSITWGPNIKVFSKDTELRNLIGKIDEELGIDGTPELIDSDGFQLDARPFRETGARAVYFNSGGYDNSIVWHRPDDIPENVPSDCVEISFLLCRELMRRIQAE